MTTKPAWLDDADAVVASWYSSAIHLYALDLHRNDAPLCAICGADATEFDLRDAAHYCADHPIPQSASEAPPIVKTAAGAEPKAGAA